MASRLPGVRNKVLDGQLGKAGVTGVGAFAAVGVASKVPGDIRILGTPEEAREVLGVGLLAEVASSSLGLTATSCYAVSVDGTKTAPTIAATAGNAGKGTVAIKAGSQSTAQYTIKLRITKAGDLAAANYLLTIDGVAQPERTTPSAASADYTIPGTGITLTFGGTGFAVGDSWTIEGAAPTATNSDILDAINTLLRSKHRYEWIAVAGVSTSALWAALAARAELAADNGRWGHFKLQARGPAAGESTADWVNALIGTERGNAVSARLQVWAARVLEATPFGEYEPRGMLGLSCGLSAGLLPHEPVDEVANGAIPGADGIVPADLTDEQILALNNAGYATVRTYPGDEGIFVTHGRMLVPSDSDYEFEERRRVMDKACRQVAQIQRRNYLNADVEITPGGLDMFRRVSEQPLERMRDDGGEITDFEIILNERQDILATDTVKTRIRVTPLGKMVQIENEISYHNPFRNAQRAAASEEA